MSGEMTIVPKRCAIYTRKSTNSRLELEVNSLTTQHEICTAYVASQQYRATRPGRFCGGGEFTLLTGNSGAAWRHIAAAVSDELGVPIKVVTIGLGQDYQDFYGDYARVSEVEESGALLVRPDVYVGWRAKSLTPTAQADLRAAFASILGRNEASTSSNVQARGELQAAGKFDEIERVNYP